jgi:hypothetical protein
MVGRRHQARRRSLEIVHCRGVRSPVGELLRPTAACDDRPVKARLHVIAEGVRRAVRAEPHRAGVAQTIELEYPVNPRPRWGYDHPPHPELARLIGSGRDRYAERLRSLLPLVEELAQIPFESDGREPRWLNTYFQGLDAVSLYGFLVERKPATYLEVGAGHSTRFARRAIERHGLSTRIASIDPSPRAALEGLADEHVQTPLEDADLSLFDQLTSGDLLMIDGSHRVFMNSDVTVFFCEILPRLPSGLLVYVDDIFLPWDYPPQLGGHWWSEQYLLAAWLLAGDRLEVTLPNFWVSTEPELHRILAPLWDQFTWAAVPTNGTGFWITIR